MEEDRRLLLAVMCYCIKMWLSTGSFQGAIGVALVFGYKWGEFLKMILAYPLSLGSCSFYCLLATGEEEEKKKGLKTSLFPTIIRKKKFPIKIFKSECCYCKYGPIWISHGCRVLVFRCAILFKRCPKEPSCWAVTRDVASKLWRSVKKKDLCLFKSAVEVLTYKRILAGNKWNIFLGNFNGRSPYGGWDCSASKAVMISLWRWGNYLQAEGMILAQEIPSYAGVSFSFSLRNMCCVWGRWICIEGLAVAKQFGLPYCSRNMDMLWVLWIASEIFFTLPCSLIEEICYTARIRFMEQPVVPAL